MQVTTVLSSEIDEDASRLIVLLIDISKYTVCILAEREAMAAMVAAASTETTSQNSLSPGHPRERSVSPTLIKYAHRRSVSPDHQDDSNQVNFAVYFLFKKCFLNIQIDPHIVRPIIAKTVLYYSLNFV